VFVGPNSGGKSAIFDALISFSMVCRGNLSEAFSQYPYSFEALRHHGASSSARIRYEAELALEAGSNETLCYTIEFSQNAGSYDEPTYSIHNEELKSGAHVFFSRSDDVTNIPGLGTLQTKVGASLARFDAQLPQESGTKHSPMTHRFCNTVRKRSVESGVTALIPIFWRSPVELLT
jgi:predicted ATPase